RLAVENADVARERRAPASSALARKRRVPGSRDRLCDLGVPEIRRSAVAVSPFGGDPALWAHQRELAPERFLNGEDDAQRRALPRRDRRGQDREIGRLVAGAGRTLRL